jgi:hypothetical protein
MGLYNTFGTYDSAITVEVKSMEQVIKLLALWACAMCAQLVLAQQTQQSPIDERYFADKVYPVLEKAECRLCHNDNGVSSATRLRFPPAEAKAEAIQIFGLKLASLVDHKDHSQSLLLNKPTVRVPHTGGERIVKGSAQEEILKLWVTHLAALNESQLRASIERLSPGQPGPSKPSALRRLTHSQYNNTVRDLLGDFTRPADQFPPEDFLNGFTNQVEGQSVPPLLAEAYTIAAEKLAANAFRRGDSQRLIHCKPASPTDRVCREQFIREFGLRAFRRPLTAKEMAGYSELFANAAASQREFLTGAKVVVEAMLQSPSFLFHLENGPEGRWRQYGIASRLSYFLWDTLPNDELLRAATAGELGRPDEISKVARHMIDNQQSRRSLEVFLGQWLRFDRVMASVRNERMYPDFSTSLLPVMTEETKHLFNYLVWKDKNFMQMFNADYTFLSARLAQHYGMEAPSEEFGMVKYPASSTRAGVLGHAGLLTLTGGPSNTSPTARGLFVREHFLCQNVPPPPPGVDTNLPAVTAEKPLTNKDRLKVHLTNKSCAACHTLVDPIGFGFENFDNTGRQRAKLVLKIQLPRDSVTNKPRDPQVFELPLDTTAHIQGIPNSNFSTVKELGDILANDATCQRCVVKQVFRYAAGRHETEFDQPYLDTMFDVFQKSGFHFRELLLAVVTSQPFLGDSVTRGLRAGGKQQRGL